MGVLGLVAYFFGGSILAGFASCWAGVTALPHTSSITLTALWSGLARVPLLDELVWAAIQGAGFGTFISFLHNLLSGRLRRLTVKEWILKLLLAIGVGIFMGLIGVYLGLLPNANWLEGQPPNFEGPIPHVFDQLGFGGGAGGPPAGSSLAFFILLVLVAIAFLFVSVLICGSLGSILGALLLGAAQGAAKGAVEGAASSASRATVDDELVREASLKGNKEGIREGAIQGIVMVIVGITAIAILGPSSSWAWLPIGIFNFLFALFTLLVMYSKDPE